MPWVGGVVLHVGCPGWRGGLACELSGLVGWSCMWAVRVGGVVLHVSCPGWWGGLACGLSEGCSGRVLP